MESTAMPQQPPHQQPVSMSKSSSGMWLWLGIVLAMVLAAIALYVGLTASNDSQDALDATANTDITQVQDDIDALQNQVDSINQTLAAQADAGTDATGEPAQDLAALDERFDQMDARLASLSSQVSALSTEVDELKQAQETAQPAAPTGE